VRKTAENLGLDQRRIARRQGVAPCAQPGGAADGHPLRHAVNKTPALAQKQYDVSHNDFRWYAAPKGQEVARKEGGQHARALDAKVEAFTPVEEFGGQLETRSVLGRWIHVRLARRR
jgi:hypothetical protein